MCFGYHIHPTLAGGMKTFSHTRPELPIRARVGGGILPAIADPCFPLPWKSASIPTHTHPHTPEHEGIRTCAGVRNSSRRSISRRVYLNGHASCYCAFFWHCRYSVRLHTHIQPAPEPAPAPNPHSRTDVRANCPRYPPTPTRTNAHTYIQNCRVQVGGRSCLQDHLAWETCRGPPVRRRRRSASRDPHDEKEGPVARPRSFKYHFRAFFF